MNKSTSTLNSPIVSEVYKEILISDLESMQPFPVRANGPKFIFKINEFQGGLQQMQQDPKDPTKQIEIKDWQGKAFPIGCGFTNPTDKSPQVFPSDGSGILIINNPTNAQEDLLKKYFANADLQNPIPTKLNELVKFLKKNDMLDFYNSEREYPDKSLEKVVNGGSMNDENIYCTYKGNPNKVIEAYYVPGKVAFNGGPTQQKSEDGMVIVRLKTGKDKETGKDIFSYRGIQLEAFKETYLKGDQSLSEEHGKISSLDDLKSYLIGNQKHMVQSHEASANGPSMGK